MDGTAPTEHLRREFESTPTKSTPTNPSADATAEVSLTFDKQASDGLSVTIQELSTSVDIRLVVRLAGGGDELGRENIAAGASHTDYQFDLDDPVEPPAEHDLAVSAYSPDNGDSYAYVTAQVRFTEEDVSVISGFAPTEIAASEVDGSNYPFFLYAPERWSDEAAFPVLVQPNNTGTSTDTFEKHRAAAEETISRSFVREVADELSAPLLVPVFPRPRTEPVDWHHYVHALDDTTMGIQDGPLERVDLQLLAMVDRARTYLADRGYPVADGLHLNGFSASGTFVERFTALHPDEVSAVSGGGLNGMVTLPIEQARGRTLEYPIGTADVEALTGSPFDRATFRSVPQFLYHGEFDGSDTIPYTDAWTDDAKRETALAVYGREMSRDRFPTCRAVHEAADTNAIFRLYRGEHHSPRAAFSDVVAFHRRIAAGEVVDDIRPDIGGGVPNARAHIRYAPTEPVAGRQVAFDATRSAVPNTDVAAYEWDFGDGATQTGALATHTFDEPGTYRVTLTTTDDGDERHRSIEYVTVGERGAA